MTSTAKLMRTVPLLAAFALAACAGSPDEPSSTERVRQELTALQSNPELASRAPVAMREAEIAVNAAENADDDAEREHLVFIAENRVDIAEAVATQRLYVDRRDELRNERDRMRLEARTREAELARNEARQLGMQASASREETEQLRMQAIASREEAEQLRRQVEELNAKPARGGMVVTLRDVLFEVDRAELKAGAHPDLDRLAEFLDEYEERDIRIQGHTDSTGDESYNMDLSQRRAEAVKNYLVDRGIEENRIRTSGRGEGMPIASNDTSGGRQLNRRVEILIENPSLAQNERRRR